MKLRSEIKKLVVTLAEDPIKLNSLIAALSSEKIDRKFPTFSKAVLEISKNFQTSGIIPMRLHAGTNAPPKWPRERRVLFLSWLRNDILVTRLPEPGKAGRANGPALEISIFGHGEITFSLNVRYHEGAYTNQVLNFRDGGIFLDAAWDRIDDQAYQVIVDWNGEESNPVTLSELQALACKAPIRSTIGKQTRFRMESPVPASAQKSITSLVRHVVGNAHDLMPFFFSALFPLKPTSGKPYTPMGGKITPECLRKLLRKLESRCQNVNCPILQGKEVKLKMAHLVRGVHELANVILLCSHCTDCQYPHLSDIKLIKQIRTDRNGNRIYRVKMPTEAGIKDWDIRSAADHRLSVVERVRK